MINLNDLDWPGRVLTPEAVLERIRPGMGIFLGTGAAEPPTLVKGLLTSQLHNLKDLEIIQLVATEAVMSGLALDPDSKFRLQTFFARSPSPDTARSVDVIPGRFSDIPWMIRQGVIRVDAVFVQVTPPSQGGFVSLGLSVDVTRIAMEKAALIVGEINEAVPRTMGDTFAHVSEFDYFVYSRDPLTCMPRPSVDEAFDRLAANVASVIEDGSCLNFYPGIVFEALGRHLQTRKRLGVHSTFFTDPLMDLVKCGAVDNSNKGSFRGKSVTVYGLGTGELERWLDQNPLVEFQPIDVVSDGDHVARNEKSVAIVPARKVDVTGGVALHTGQGTVAATPGQAQDIFARTERSQGARKIFALPSRNRSGEPNFLLSVGAYPNLFTHREYLDLIVSEYGIASLRGRSVRERAQSIIDIAHPDDRDRLICQAREAGILYADQIYVSRAGRRYPEKLAHTQSFKGGVTVRFRAIKPSDEEGMRRLFYRFSDQSVYYRYFGSVKVMPHTMVQQYVNVDYQRFMSIVGVVEEGGIERIVAEGRYVRMEDHPDAADVAFVVDETYQGMGIASHLLRLLVEIARDEDIETFRADVLAANRAMFRVFEKLACPVSSALDGSVLNLTISLQGIATGP